MDEAKLKLDRRQLLGGTAALAAGSIIGDGAWAAARAESGWIPLFNGRNLDGWRTTLNRGGKSAEASRLLRVENGMIHVLGVDPTAEQPEAGYFATEQAYGDYQLRVEYRWGERRFPPRELWKRDNGILYHVTGEDRVWPACMEFQIQESDVGDALAVPGALGQGGVRFTPGLLDSGGPPGLPAWPNPPRRANDPSWRPPTTTVMRKQGDFEHHDGGWNVLDLICIGDKAAHVVNGRIVASAYNIEIRDGAAPSGYRPLDRGRIALEVEYAETWIRRIDLKPLPRT